MLDAGYWILDTGWIELRNADRRPPMGETSELGLLMPVGPATSVALREGGRLRRAGEYLRNAGWNNDQQQDQERDYQEERNRSGGLDRRSSSGQAGRAPQPEHPGLRANRDGSRGRKGKRKTLPRTNQEAPPMRRQCEN
jgi:hypothetical protein